MQKFTLSTVFILTLLCFSGLVMSRSHRNIQRNTAKMQWATGVANVAGSTPVSQAPVNCAAYGPNDPTYVAVPKELFQCGATITLSAGFGKQQQAAVGKVSGICENCAASDIVVSKRLAAKLLAADFANLGKKFAVNWRIG